MSPSRRVGAFFDVDGTVLPGPSLEMRFAWWLLTQNRIGGSRLALWATEAALAFVRGDRRALHANKKYLAALPESVVAIWKESLSPDRLAVFPQAAERIEWHASQGHHVCFVSGTLEPLADVLAQHLASSVRAHATRLEAVEGIWTGFLRGNHASLAEKAEIVAEIAHRESLSLERSYGYGNHADDIPMLESVGNPVAVNPRFRLQKTAACRNWKIERWDIPSTAPVAAAAKPIVFSEEGH